MNDRTPTDYPEDEPVIGGTFARAAAPPLEPPGTPRYIGALPATEYVEEEPTIGYAYPDDGVEYAEESEYDDGEYYDEDDAYYDEDEYDRAPAKQPMFYIFVALSALVGGIVVFLLFSLVNNGGDDGDPAAAAATGFAVKIESPPKDKRVEIGRSEEVLVLASATEPIVRFELFVGDKLTDTVNVSETPADNRYRAVMNLTPTTKGTYQISVKVTASSGATKTSDKVQIIAFEPVGGRPQTIKGKVVADTTLRTGPADSYAEAGTLKAGQDITILGKSKAVDWLLVSSPQGDRWVKRTAIDNLDSLDLVPVRDVTPTPAPTQPPTSTTLPSPSPSETTSPSPSPNSPDFVPSSASLAEGGSKLRITVQNVGSAAYSGPLVVSLAGDVPGGQVVVNAQLAANGGNATVEFDISPPVTEAGKKALVTVDPGNAVKELREDNNGATFVLLPPDEAPAIVMGAPTVGASNVTVTIQNTGGPMPATTVVVRVKAGDSAAEQSQTIALAKDQTATFTVAKPGTGAATAEVLINGQVVQSASFTIDP